MQCPHNPHHYLPKSSMEEHTKKCGYAVALNTSIWSLEEDRLISLETDSSFLYKDSSAVESVKIGMVSSSLNVPCYLICLGLEVVQQRSFQT